MSVLREIKEGILQNRLLVIGGLAFIGASQLVSVYATSDPVVAALYYPYKVIAPIYYYGDEHQCNLCGREMRRFRLAKGSTGWECPFCLSRPRHRTTWTYFKERTNLPDGRPAEEYASHRSGTVCRVGNWRGGPSGLQLGCVRGFPLRARLAVSVAPLDCNHARQRQLRRRLMQ